MSEISARDRKTLVELVQSAQLVDAFGHLPKKQFMDRPHDQARVAERVIDMRRRAGDLSAAFRKARPTAPWDDLEGLGHAPEDLWRAAKKVTPKLLAELEPLVAEMPEAGFLITERPRGTRRASPGTRAGSKGGSGGQEKRRAGADRP